MIAFFCTLAMKEKMISYGITRIFFNLFRNILLIWHNKDMKILLFIIIGFTFVIILNFYRFKSLFLPLYIMVLFSEKLAASFSFLFRIFFWCRSFFFCYFCLLRIHVGYVCCYFYCESHYYCVYSFSVDSVYFLGFTDIAFIVY